MGLLDADTQYYALPDDAAGINPAIDDNSAIQQIIASLTQQPPAPGAAPGQAPLVPMAGDPSAPQGPPAGYVPGQPAVPMAPGAIPQPLPYDPTAGINPAIDTQAAAQAAYQPPLPIPVLPNQTPPQGNSNSAPGQSGAPQMPRHNNTVLQALGVIAGLMGGPGARVAAGILANQKQNDTDNYNRQVQQQQQQFQNQTAQSEAGTAFLQNLSKLDGATQEQAVRNMSPAQMMAAGFTPQQVQSQFFDASGKFIPVNAADKQENPAQLLRAQVSGRARLFDLTPQAQQALHDSYKDSPDEWQQQYGLPYAGFTPGQTVKEQQGDEKLDQGDTRLGQQQSAVQQIAYKQLMAMTPQVQGQMWKSYAAHPELFEQKFGVPYAGFQPGQTDANQIAETGVNNREADAQRTDATRVKLGQANIAARFAIDKANNDVALRGQDLRSQLGEKQIQQRAMQFKMRYGASGAGAAEKQYQAIVKQRLALMNEMTKLSTPGKDPITGEATLSPRDEGRIDANGNVVQNPTPTAAYTEYMQLQQFDQALQQQQAQLKAPPAAPASPLASMGALPSVGAPMPAAPGQRLMPAPVAVPPAVQRAIAARHPAGLGPLPSFPAYTSHGTVPASPQASLPLPRATGSGGAAGTNGRLLIQGSIGKTPFLFHAPISKSDFDALTPLKRHAYIQYMRQQGKVRS